MIRSVLRLAARDGDAEAVVDFYRRYQLLERALKQDGCLEAELQVPTSRQGDLLVTALWRDEDAYRGWLDNPARREHVEELAQLVGPRIGLLVFGNDSAVNSWIWQ